MGSHGRGASRRLSLCLVYVPIPSATNPGDMSALHCHFVDEHGFSRIRSGKPADSVAPDSQDEKTPVDTGAQGTIHAESENPRAMLGLSNGCHSNPPTT